MINTRRSRWAAGIVVAALVLASCGDDDDEATADTAAPVTTAASDDGADASGEGIVLAVNPWTGSAVNANVAKVVLESELGTSVELLDIDENATWVGMDDGSIDAVLEIWPSGHVADYATYIDGKGSVVDIGPLGAEAKIGWYVPSWVIEEHPELATWEGFEDPELAGLFATAESGDLGQFLMGDPSYVSYDEQIIANLGLPLKFVVGGSEAAIISAFEQSMTDQKPVLAYFWQPHWLHSQMDLTEVQLPEVTDECLASLEAGDGNYACDYPADVLYKAASAGLQAKNAAAFDFLSAFQLTTEQQNEIAAMVESEGMSAADAAAAWVGANPDVVQSWLG